VRVLEGGVSLIMSAECLANMRQDPSQYIPPLVWHGCCGSYVERRPMMFTPYRFMYPEVGVDTWLMMTTPCKFCGQVVWYELRSIQNDKEPVQRNG